jgi:hypothetical protein
MADNDDVASLRRLAGRETGRQFEHPVLTGLFSRYPSPSQLFKQVVSLLRFASGLLFPAFVGSSLRITVVAIFCFRLSVDELFSRHADCSCARKSEAGFC